MTEHQLRVIHALAQTGSVRLAAERLVVTPPAISTAIAALERELGVSLTERHGRGLVLTDAGRLLADRAAQILGLVDETVGEVREAARAGQGRLRLAAVTTAVEHLLPPILGRYRHLYPASEITVEVLNRRVLWERLLAHQVDVGIAGRPPRDRQLVGIPVAPNDLVVIAPPGEGARLRQAEELEGWTWLLREPGSGTRENAEEWLAAQGLHPPTLTVGSNGAIVRLVALGLGLALISSLAVDEDVRAGRVDLISLPGLPIHRQWQAVIRRDEPLPPPAARFLELLQAGARNDP
jgi:DNA-binding transcriptional LysR family regulator